MEYFYSIKFVVALEAEAEPIIQDYGLKRIHYINLFKVYRNNSGNHWLIISGIGCINAAAASIFLYQYSNANKSSFWFNIGIAGYFKGPAGEIFLVDKILDEVTCQTHFPRSALTKKIKRDENSKSPQKCKKEKENCSSVLQSSPKKKTDGNIKS